MESTEEMKWHYICGAKNSKFGLMYHSNFFCCNKLYYREKDGIESAINEDGTIVSCLHQSDTDLRSKNFL